MRITVIGGGNIGTLMAADAAYKGDEVVSYTSKPGEWNGEPSDELTQLQSQRHTRKRQPCQHVVLGTWDSHPRKSQFKMYQGPYCRGSRPC